MWLVAIVQDSAALDQTPYFKGKVIFIFFKQQNYTQNLSSPISSSVFCLLNQVPFLLFPVVKFQFVTFIFTEDPQRLSNPLLYPLKLPNCFERSQSLQNRKILTYEVKVTQSCPNLCNPMDRMQSARLLCPWNSPGQNTGQKNILQIDNKVKM